MGKAPDEEWIREYLSWFEAYDPDLNPEYIPEDSRTHCKDHPDEIQ